MKKLVLVVTLFFSSFSVYAETAYFIGKVVTTTILDNSIAGSCIVLMDRTLESQGLSGCDSGWVSFDCAGRLDRSKDISFRMFDQAQMAIALDRFVAVQVTDAADRRLDGVCYGTRIDVYSE